jgi:hypothetical protein
MNQTASYDLASTVHHSLSSGVRYVGDGKSFWRPLVAAAMGTTMEDPRLEVWQQWILRSHIIHQV